MLYMNITTGKQMDTTWDCTWFPEDHNACYNCIVGNDKERLLILCIYLLMQIQSWNMMYVKVYLIKIRRLSNPFNDILKSNDIPYAITSKVVFLTDQSTTSQSNCEVLKRSTHREIVSDWVIHLSLLTFFFVF